ncbi:hypothetical protein T06_16510 [Trichinella sp. T6]|nr:hypothetical protein T06_16510 [Trichinella sp. T6]
MRRNSTLSRPTFTYTLYTTIEPGTEFRKNYLRKCPGRSLKTYPSEGKYCAIKCFGRSLREYANFYLPWGIA